MRTNVIATIGPSSIDKNILGQLVSEGVDIIRINTSYGDVEQYKNILQNLKEVDPNSHVKKMLDIKSEEILSFCDENEMDLIAVSFAESKEQIESVKSKYPNCVVISKIESVKGVSNYNEILAGGGISFDIHYRAFYFQLGDGNHHRPCCD